MGPAGQDVRSLKLGPPRPGQDALLHDTLPQRSPPGTAARQQHEPGPLEPSRPLAVLRGA